MTTAVAIDWAAVRMTDAARNTNKSAHLLRVVCVPRAHMERTWHGREWATWGALEAAAAVGVDGVEPLVVHETKDLPAADVAFMRGEESYERLRLLSGRSLLFRQGW